MHYDTKGDTDFEKWWATKIAEGYDYGYEALSNVHFGFSAAREIAQPRIEKLELTLREFGFHSMGCRSLRLGKGRHPAECDCGLDVVLKGRV